MLTSTTLPETLAIDDAVGRAALRKAGWRLIPMIAFGYGIAFLDRANISFAALQMNRDLHFSATVYGFGAGLFFISYAACEVPSNLLLYRVGARRWFARILLTWGLLAMGMMLVKTPLEFYVMRFLLGAAEAGFFPGVVFYLSQWFPTHMRARAIGRFYVSLPVSSVVMGLVAGALLDLQGKAGLAGWQWLFLIEGLPAVLLSFVFFSSCRIVPRTRDGLRQKSERGFCIMCAQSMDTRSRWAARCSIRGCGRSACCFCAGSRAVMRIPFPPPRFCRRLRGSITARWATSRRR